MMRKNDSKGGMPFSWEKKPGIPKVIPTMTRAHQKHKCPTHPEMEIGRPVSSSSSSSSCDLATATATAPTNKKVCVEQQEEPLKIPLPPCLLQPPYSSSSRNSSMKGLGPLGLRRQQDPFLAAYKECTKSVRNGNCTSSRYPNNSNSTINNGEDGNRKHERRSGSSLLGKSAFLFSCKHSCEIRDDSFVTLSHLHLPPPAPRSGLSKHRYSNN